MIKGLTSEQALKLRREYGINVLTSRKKTNLVQLFIRQLSSFLILLLFAAACLSFFIGEMIDGMMILAIIILNAVFGVYQESKAEQAVELLRKLTITTVRVKRDGNEKEIDSRELVPGDVFFIEEGGKIPADAIICQTLGVEINEASLTGESMPVIKMVGDEVYMGTIVVKGKAWVRVSQIGMKTKFGVIAAELSRMEEEKTPLQRKIEYLTETIGLGGIILSLAIFILSLIKGNGYFPSFLLSVSLAVAVVPEGLPAVVTITLALGVKDMAKRRAIVRKMASIEALGSITLIATDKTGTLTENNMKVDELWLDGKIYSSIHQHIIQQPALRLFLANGILCSTASLVRAHDHGHKFEVLGDPTEGSLLKLAKDLGYEPEFVRQEWQVIEEAPFDQNLKRMSVAVRRGGTTVSYTKGAPEEIIRICQFVIRDSRVHRLTDNEKTDLLRFVANWARRGLRVIGLAYSEGENISGERYVNLNDQVLIGLAAIHDPPRPEVIESVKKAYSAGIKVVIVTGDNELTAESIGRRIGLVSEGDLIIRGEQLEKYTDEELLSLLPKIKVFARTTPIHKSRIVYLYQRQGQVVAVTGDGVNDAIALKKADVGIAMGKIGTDVARDAADVVLTDDNFTTIIAAVEEGRNTIKNLKNSIRYLLTGNLSEGLTLLFSFIFGLPPIFIPLQLLYINLLSDGIPALALAFSPRDRFNMQRGPDRKLSLLNRHSFGYILLIGVIGASLAIASFFIFGKNNELLGRTAVFNVVTMMQSFIFLDIWLANNSLRSHWASLISRPFLIGYLGPFFCQLLIVKLSILADLFQVQTLSWSLFFYQLLFSSLLYLVIRLIRMFFYTFKH